MLVRHTPPVGAHITHVRYPPVDPVGNGELPGPANSDRPALILGLLIAVGVCWPLVGGGRLFLLDWVLGPHVSFVPSSAYGLNGGLTAGLPSSLAIGILAHLIGSAATWVPIALFFPLATVSASRLVGERQWARLGAAALYAVNPFVFQRLFAGQLGLLLGYALLPLVVRSMVRAVDARGVARLAPVLWMAMLTALAPHFAWICGVVLVAVVATRRGRVAATAWAATVGLCFLPTLAYVFLPGSSASLPVTVGTRSLAAYRTTGDPRIGLFGNVAGLYGFWRRGPGPVLPKNVVSLWLLLLFLVLVVVAVGAVSALGGKLGGKRTDHGTDRRRLAAAVVVAGVLGFFLALGNQGPTGPVFAWAYGHVPFFRIMREPEKFSALLALAYAACFGWGVERLATGVAAHRRRLGGAAAVALAVALPLAYTPTIFDGMAGQIAPSHLPASWSRADAVMGTGPGKLLFLPWHLYLAFPFTNGRVVANPAPSSFRRSVISGDDVQLPNAYSDSTSPRSAYLVRLYGEAGSGGLFGAQIAPLGVQYVALAKTVDWRSFAWLAHQPDLQLVLDTPTLELWRNRSYQGLGHRIGDRGGKAVQRLSPVAYRIPPGPPGQVPSGQVTVAIPYQPGWSFQGHPARQSPDGVLTVTAGRSGGVLRFGPWHRAELGDLVSVVVLGVLAAALAVERRRRRRCGQPAGPEPPVGQVA